MRGFCESVCVCGQTEICAERAARGGCVEKGEEERRGGLGRSVDSFQ